MTDRPVVLVTGSSGLIGSAVSRRLLERCAVVGFAARAAASGHPTGHRFHSDRQDIVPIAGLTVGPSSIPSAAAARRQGGPRGRQAMDMLRRGIAIDEICQKLGRTRQWLGKWRGRFEAEGAAALRGRSRAPRHRPRATPGRIVRAVLAARDRLARRRGRRRFAGSGADAVAWELELSGVRPLPARRTLERILARNGRTARPRPTPRLTSKVAELEKRSAVLRDLIKPGFDVSAFHTFYDPLMAAAKEADAVFHELLRTVGLGHEVGPRIGHTHAPLSEDAFDDGSPYYPIGIGDCLLDVEGSGSPIDNWGLDGEFRPAGSHELGRLVDIDTYLAAYAAPGVDLFRWSIDNCAFKLASSVDHSGPRFLVQEGLWGDALVTKLRQYGFRVYMAIFGFEPPFPSAAPGSPEMEAVKRYVRYVVDRYGAYVDFWELMNEATAPDAWTVEVARYLREIDPHRHPISTSWERPDLSVIEIDSPHWYEREDEFESDRLTLHRIEGWKAAGKPVIVGEQGNTLQNWDDRSALRTRLRSWTALFGEAVLIFWNSSFAKDYRSPDAASIYLRPEERGDVKVLSACARASGGSPCLDRPSVPLQKGGH